MNQTAPQPREHRFNSACARVEAATQREMNLRTFEPPTWAGALLRESIRVMQIAKFPRQRIVAILQTAANHVSHGRPIREFQV